MTLIILILSLFPIHLKAPVTDCLIITKPEAIYVFNIKDPTLRAFIRFESFYNESAVNPVSGARGILQFLPVMIHEVNRILLECDPGHQLYTWDDAFNAEKSIAMWYIVQRYHNPEYDIQRACRIWFGIGTQYDGLTWVGYHDEIQKRLI